MARGTRSEASGRLREVQRDVPEGDADRVGETGRRASRGVSRMTAGYGDTRLPDRFWSKVIQEPISGCWLWIGATNRGGYGVIGNGPRGSGNSLTHRFSFRALGGSIAAGLELDHLCRVRSCCNPDHLEPVTRSTNIVRGLGPATLRAKYAAIVACPAGHGYSDDNTRRYRGCRHCVECNRIGSRERQRRLKAERLSRAKVGP